MISKILKNVLLSCEIILFGSFCFWSFCFCRRFEIEVMNMNFLTSLKKVLLFDTTINDPGQQVHKQIWNDNRRFALIWSFAALFYWGFCIFMSFREERFYICRNVYIVTIILSALELFATLFLVKKNPQLINLIQFLINATVMGGGLFIE